MILIPTVRVLWSKALLQRQSTSGSNPIARKGFLTKINLIDLAGQKIQAMGSGCGSVGRVVASDSRDPQFESSHRQTFIEHLFTVN